MSRIHPAATAALAALAIATASAATGASDDPTDRTLRAIGPTVVHDATYVGIRSAVKATSTADGRTIVTLHLSGLPEEAHGSTLGAHVHTGSCGSDPAASGPHHVDPDAPAGTPLHASEIWLDVHVNTAGQGRATTTADWVIDRGAARSVVVHANPTDPTTGAAGSRLFCTDVPFGVAP